MHPYLFLLSLGQGLNDTGNYIILFSKFFISLSGLDTHVIMDKIVKLVMVT